MINSSFHLYQLQKIDLKIDSITRRLNEIARIRNDNSAHKTIEQSLLSVNNLLTEQNHIYNELEDKIRSKKLKIEQSESSLYGGLVKNPKELQDLQSEIKSLKTSLSSLEDDQLQIMIIQESLDRELETVRVSMKELESQLEIQYSSLFTEEAEKKIELEKIHQERKAILEQINSENLDHYQSLRKTKNGIALATIEDGCCAVCGSTLTPAECQQAKSPNRMATCASCGRILYAG
jgi:uncharacterized protein